MATVLERGELTAALPQDIRAPSGAADPNNMTLLAEEARALADR